MRARKPVQHLFAQRCQPDANLAAVATRANPLDQPSVRQTVRQFYRAVMPDKQARGEFAHCRLPVFGSANCQQQLVLPRFQRLGPGRLLAEMQEPSNLEAELVQSPIIGETQILHMNYRITIYYE